MCAYDYTAWGAQVCFGCCFCRGSRMLTERIGPAFLFLFSQMLIRNCIAMDHDGHDTDFHAVFSLALDSYTH